MTVTATVAERADLRGLSDDGLLALYRAASEDEQVRILAEAERRDRAADARKARQAAESEWLIAAEAQYRQASDAGRGHLLIPAARTDPKAPATELALWRGSEAWARRWASEDLREWWDANGGRLSIARWRREQAADRRQARDERDLERMAAGTYKPPAPRVRKPATIPPMPAMPAVDHTAPLADRMRQVMAQGEWLAESAKRRNARMQQILSRVAARNAARLTERNRP